MVPPKRRALRAWWSVAGTMSHFTPDSAYTYERMEWVHKDCEIKGISRSTFKMDFAS
jgi:hypothetical protein